MILVMLCVIFALGVVFLVWLITLDARTLIIDECGHCGKGLTGRRAHVVAEVCNDRDIGVGWGGQTGVSISYCGAHCPGGCQRGCREARAA